MGNASAKAVVDTRGHNNIIRLKEAPQLGSSRDGGRRMTVAVAVGISHGSDDGDDGEDEGCECIV